MSFVWPEALWLLLAIPVLVAIYVAILHRKRKAAVRFASIGVLREALGAGHNFRRHVPPLLLLLALTVLVVAIARPRATITLPSEQRTIVLAMDVSLSMRANDVQPSRMAAARDAAKAFVRAQPDDVRIALVEFAAQAVVVQQPTRDRDELDAAIDRLQLQVHTNIGSAMIMSLAVLFPDEGLELEADSYSAGPLRDKPRGVPIERAQGPEKKEPKSVPPGSYRSGAIILLTDGRRTIGPDPVDAARLAADHGVKVYTVGFGSAEGGTANVDGMPIYMRFDAETLQAIAQITAAEYFHAGTADDLKHVYEGLNAKYVLEKRPTEMSALASAAAALIMLLAAALSIAWFHRGS
jgi:Ca-activated chloride channel family protein